MEESYDDLLAINEKRKQKRQDERLMSQIVSDADSAEFRCKNPLLILFRAESPVDSSRPDQWTNQTTRGCNRAGRALLAHLFGLGRVHNDEAN